MKRGNIVIDGVIIHGLSGEYKRASIISMLILIMLALFY